MSLMTMKEALNQCLHRAMTTDDTLLVFGEDVVGGTDSQNLGGVFGVTKGLREKFGASRVFDTPISESAFVGMATGAAICGLKPVIEIMFCDFLPVCFDQLVNQAAKARFLSAGQNSVPMVIRTTMGAGDGSAAMHSQSLAHLLASMPGLKVGMPATPHDAYDMLNTAIADPDPVILFEHKGLYDMVGKVSSATPHTPLGSAHIVKKGSDITIVAFSAMRHLATGIADTMAQKGVDVEVIDPRWIAPLDLDTITASVKKTGRLLVIDEGAANLGIASEIIAKTTTHCFKNLKCAPRAITPPHTPTPYAKNLEKLWLPHQTTIIKTIENMLKL